MRHPRRLALTGLLCLSLSITACSSRRPTSDFTAAGNSTLQQDKGTGGTTGDGSTGGSTTGTNAGTSTGTSTGGTSAGGTTGGSAGGTTGGAANTTSDIGVTATTINLGNIVTKSGALGPDQFTPFYYGAAAYFDDLNARGGINGRKVVFNTCDDAGTPSGNTACARNFVDTKKVFALVANNCLACDGLKYVSSKAVPSVGGLAIDSRDYSLPHTWRYSGDPYPQNGSIGYKGKLYAGTQQYRFFKEHYGVQKAGVVYDDNSSASKNAGLAAIDALRAEGIEATGYPITVGIAQYDSAVIDMKNKGITAVWDSIGGSGDQALCKSIDTNGLVLKALVSPSSRWGHAAVEQFPAPCRTYFFNIEDPGAATYDQTSNPEIAKFRAALKRYFPSREDKLFQWYVDGWASAMWFADAAASCGANLTRVCLETYLNLPTGYTARGLWWPRNNDKVNFITQKTVYRCIQVTQWVDSAKTFVVRGPYRSTCWTTPYLPYSAPL